MATPPRCASERSGCARPSAGWARSRSAEPPPARALHRGFWQYAQAALQISDRAYVLVGGRVAAEGLIGAVTSGAKGVVVEVNSETDFVARNEQFQGLVKMIAQVALKVGADVEKIKAAKVGDATVETAISDAIATIGENIRVRRFVRYALGEEL